MSWEVMIKPVLDLLYTLMGRAKDSTARKKAETELGEKFDIRGFHDAILGGGAMPLDLVERRVDRWIASRKAG